MSGLEVLGLVIGLSSQLSQLRKISNIPTYTRKYQLQLSTEQVRLDAIFKKIKSLANTGALDVLGSPTLDHIRELARLSATQLAQARRHLEKLDNTYSAFKFLLSSNQLEETAQRLHEYIDRLYEIFKAVELDVFTGNLPTGKDASGEPSSQRFSPETPKKTSLAAVPKNSLSTVLTSKDNGKTAVLRELQGGCIDLITHIQSFSGENIKKILCETVIRMKLWETAIFAGPDIWYILLPLAETKLMSHALEIFEETIPYFEVPQASKKETDRILINLQILLGNVSLRDNGYVELEDIQSLCDAEGALIAEECQRFGAEEVQRLVGVLFNILPSLLRTSALLRQDNATIAEIPVAVTESNIDYSEKVLSLLECCILLSEDIGSHPSKAQTLHTSIETDIANTMVKQAALLKKWKERNGRHLEGQLTSQNEEMKNAMGGILVEMTSTLVEIGRRSGSHLKLGKEIKQAEVLLDELKSRGLLKGQLRDLDPLKLTRSIDFNIDDAVSDLKSYMKQLDNLEEPLHDLPPPPYSTVKA